MGETSVRRPYTAERRSSWNQTVNGSNGIKVSNSDLLRAIGQLQTLVVAAAEAEAKDALETNEPAAKPSEPSAPPVADPEIDRVRAEIGQMAKTIERTKAEIAAIKHPLAENDPVLTASSQLDAIVQATESATQDILDCTEQVEEVIKRMVALDPENEELINLSDEAGGHLIKIMEACGFQDITGQRITKVVTALQQVEQKVEALMQAFGDDIKRDGPAKSQDKKKTAPSGAPARPDEDLLNGPQLPENASSQDDIDALFD